MFKIIINVTLGIVFAFCAAMIFCVLLADKFFLRKSKKNKPSNPTSGNDIWEESIDKSLRK